jgi:hypothetical protein
MRVTRTNIVVVLLIPALIVSLAHRPTAAGDLGWDLPEFPAEGIVAATVVRDGRWYAMDGNEMACLTKLLAQTPFTTPGIYMQAPVLPDRIILWGLRGKNLMVVDVIRFNDDVRFLRNSTGESHYYRAGDSTERTVLLELIRRIQNGTEKPLAVRAAPRAR